MLTANQMQTITNHPTFTKGLSLPQSSIHGIAHWQRVEKFGLMIAAENGADKELVSLFAYLHDARRENEYGDPEHGKRAKMLLDQLIAARLLDLSEERYEILSAALQDHNLPSANSSDTTVQTCWDADRLDLWRVGIVPDPKRLFSDIAKRKEMIDYAKELNGL